MSNKSKIKNLLKKYQLRLSKRFGQNFLIDKGIVKKVIESANLSKNDNVLEIGPGIGNLTVELAKRVKKVITVEKDHKMVEILKEVGKNFKNIKIISGDILKFLKHKKGVVAPQLCSDYKYKVVANIPYYLTSRLIKNLLELKNKPKEIILMIQKEVAQRICASPPTKKLVRGKPPKMNILAASVQFYAQPKIISYVSKKSFWPSPKVDSAIIKITPYINKYNSDQLFIKKFFKIVKAGFSQPRKQILNNLSKILKLERGKVKTWLLKNNIQPNQRAETLNLQDWFNLTLTCDKI